ncbi:MAG: class I SAM-dependent methyltransferase [Chloroflexi bacterium]|nr:class I SAM-dependent methyltransferase [Chloroflexota bacterium]
MTKSEKFWDRTAASYDQEEKKDEQTYIQIIEKTKKYLKMSDIVLDFGCGTGLIANEIADQVKAIHAIDSSSKMIELAKKKAAARSIENIDYAHATLFDERYQGGSFDAILVFHVLHLLEDTHTVMQRINELLKPGGLIISVTPCMGEKRLTSTLLSLISKMGLVPTMRSFKSAELEDSIVSGGFDIVENECLRQNTQEYFIVAKKV